MNNPSIPLFSCGYVYTYINDSSLLQSHYDSILLISHVMSCLCGAQSTCILFLAMIHFCLRFQVCKRRIVQVVPLAFMLSLTRLHKPAREPPPTHCFSHSVHGACTQSPLCAYQVQSTQHIVSSLYVGQNLRNQAELILWSTILSQDSATDLLQEHFTKQIYKQIYSLKK